MQYELFWLILSNIRWIDCDCVTAVVDTIPHNVLAFVS